MCQSPDTSLDPERFDGQSVPQGKWRERNTAKQLVLVYNQRADHNESVPVKVPVNE
jgi:hypothetical protein